MRTAAQVYQGLAGMLIVSDPEEQALGLPAGAGELVCVLQDRACTLPVLTLAPGQRADVMLDLSSHPQGSAVHLILAHEDMGLMRNFRIRA